LRRNEKSTFNMRQANIQEWKRKKWNTPASDKNYEKYIGTVSREPFQYREKYNSNSRLQKVLATFWLCMNVNNKRRHPILFIPYFLLFLSKNCCHCFFISKTSTKRKFTNYLYAIRTDEETYKGIILFLVK